jgi:hypothetical protein
MFNLAAMLRSGRGTQVSHFPFHLPLFGPFGLAPHSLSECCCLGHLGCVEASSPSSAAPSELLLNTEACLAQDSLFLLLQVDLVRARLLYHSAGLLGPHFCRFTVLMRRGRGVASCRSKSCWRSTAAFWAAAPLPPLPACAPPRAPALQAPLALVLAAPGLLPLWLTAMTRKEVTGASR